VLQIALASRRLLLVLDNCEHLRAACASLAFSLLSACPGLRLLATSREPLALAGEQLYPVAPLPLPRPEAGSTPASLLRAESVQLFLARAQAANPAFALSAETAPQVAELCRRLDGLPLALELAAAWVRSLDLATLAARLDDRFDLLASPALAALPRHQTMRATLDWSAALLAPPERRLLGRLAVFAGAFTLEAAAAIYAPEPAEQAAVPALLAGLVERSLVQCETLGTESRYALLETVRAYATELTEAAGEWDEPRARHRDWYLQFAERLAPDLFGSRQGECCDALDRELANLRLALTCCQERQEWAEALRFCAALGRWWAIRGYLQEGYDWLALTISASQSLPASPERVAALSELGLLAYALYRREGLDLAIYEGPRCARELGDPTSLVDALATAAWLRVFNNQDVPGALELCNEALGCVDAADPTDDATQELLLIRSYLALFDNDKERTQALWQRTEALIRAQGNWFRLSIYLLIGSHVARQQGDGRAAVAQARESLAKQTELRSFRQAILSLEQVAWALSDLSQTVQATTLLGAAEAARQRLGTLMLLPLERPFHDQVVATLQERLGRDRFNRLFRRGLGLSWEAALALALGQDAPRLGWAGPRLQAVEPAVAWSIEVIPLSRREREVAQLAGHGLSNRAIATALVITEGTANNHVKSILRKLGLQRRGEIADWLRGQEERSGDEAGAPTGFRSPPPVRLPTAKPK
jgi:predicted ATPase/DNA-binding CsgD family transcriptional regulator